MKNILLLVALLLGSCYAQAQQVKINYSGDKAKVSISARDSITATVKGAKVVVDSKYTTSDVTILMSGKSEDGCLLLKTAGKAKIQMKNLSLTSNEGAPLWLKNKKSVEIEALKGTRNNLEITACKDTALFKSAVIWAKGKLRFSGKGELNLLATGDGCKGINGKKDITIDELTLNVITKGDNLGKKPFGFGGGMPPFGGGAPEGGTPAFGGPGPMGPGGFPAFDFDQLPDSIKQKIEEMRKMFEANGGPMGFPGGAPQGGVPQFGAAPGGFPGFGGPMESGDPDEQIKGAFKQRYISTTKGIKSMKQVKINGGTLYVKTSSAGAEGIEGKEGIVVKDGLVRVDAIDDAINANGPIVFQGGKVFAESHCNDAIDCNFGGMSPTAAQGDPAVVISGGEIYPWSHTGAPEEGLDCDMAPIQITGGRLFTIGGGMGEMPSVPTQQSAQQPTVLFVNLSLVKGEKLSVLEAGKEIYSMTVPFSFRNSASVLSCPQLKKGATYTLRTKDVERTFTLEENFTVVR